MKLRRDDAGASALEFALVAPILIMTLGMCLALGVHAFYGGIAEHAARSAAHAATLKLTRSPTSGYPTVANIAAAAKAASPSYAGAPVISVSTLGATTPGDGDIVTVTITYDISWLHPITRFLPFGADGLSTVTHTAQARRE